MDIDAIRVYAVYAAPTGYLLGSATDRDTAEWMVGFCSWGETVIVGPIPLKGIPQQHTV